MKENAEKARALDATEIAKQLKDTSEQMFRLRFQLSMGQMDGVKKLRSLRKERARMLTVLREREDGATQVVAKPAKSTKVSKGEVAPKRTAAVKPKGAAPKSTPQNRNAGQVKVKRTNAPAAPKISTPRKTGNG
jgi:large subunit ribosomal protein L29